jgi:hypothetical protein
MKDALSNVLVAALVVVFFCAILWSTGRTVYRNYRDQQAAKHGLDHFLSELPARGFRRIPIDDQADVQRCLDRYYVLSRSQTVLLKATSAYRGEIGALPAYLLITYEKTRVFGQSLGAGQQAGRSEFQGIIVAVQQPHRFSGRSMIVRQPETSDATDWLETRPLGGGADTATEALSPTFGSEFIVKRTTGQGGLPAPLQALLLTNKHLFMNTSEKSSALILDDAGWGLVSTLVTDAAWLEDLVKFQAELARVMKETRAER